MTCSSLFLLSIEGIDGFVESFFLAFYEARLKGLLLFVILGEELYLLILLSLTLLSRASLVSLSFDLLCYFGWLSYCYLFLLFLRVSSICNS